MAVRKLGLPSVRYFQDHAIWIEKRDGRGDPREDMEYQSKANLIPQTLDRWEDEGQKIDGYAFLDDDPGQDLSRRGSLRPGRDLNLVEVNAMHGLSLREVVTAADVLGEPCSRDDEDHLLAQHDRWMEIRAADRLLRGHHSQEQMREHFLRWLRKRLF